MHYSLILLFSLHSFYKKWFTINSFLVLTINCTWATYISHTAAIYSLKKIAELESSWRIKRVRPPVNPPRDSVSIKGLSWSPPHKVGHWYRWKAAPTKAATGSQWENGTLLHGQHSSAGQARVIKMFNFFFNCQNWKSQKSTHSQECGLSLLSKKNIEETKAGNLYLLFTVTITSKTGCSP